MEKKIFFKALFMALIPAVGITTAAAQSDVPSTKKDTVSTPKAGETANVMLNASSDNGPRVVNIGLPASVGGTTILENGLPVTYDYMGQMPTTV